MSVDFRYFPALAIPGGTAGQVLTKTSSALDNAGQWSDPQAGTGPAGPAGPAGPTGPAGAAGTPGATGATGASLKSFRGIAVTDASGNATFNLTAAAFAAAPVVAVGIMALGGDQLLYRVTSVTATSCTVFVCLTLNASGTVGVTVHLIAMPAGSQV